MNNWKRSLACTVLLLNSCAKSNPTFNEGGRKASSGDIYLSLEEKNAKTPIDAVQAMAFKDIYAQLFARTNDDSFVVDGMEFSGVKSQLQALEARFNYLQDHYGSLGAFMRETFVELEILSAIEFQVAVERAHALNQDFEKQKDLTKMSPIQVKSLALIPAEQEFCDEASDMSRVDVYVPYDWSSAVLCLGAEGGAFSDVSSSPNALWMGTNLCGGILGEGVTHATAKFYQASSCQ